MVTIDDISAAAELIRPFIVRTPLVPAGWADDDRPLWIKPESLQSIGAFKVRGAFNAIGHLDESVRTRGVVAYSSGNHAQAVAYAAAVYGVPAHIVMPEETPNIKVAATRSHGAEVVLCGAGQREKVAAEVVERDRRRAGAAVRPPGHHRRAGHHRPRDRRGPARGRERARPGQRRRPRLRHRHGDQGAVPAGPRLRRRTRARGGHRGGPCVWVIGSIGRSKTGTARSPTGCGHSRPT